MMQLAQAESGCVKTVANVQAHLGENRLKVMASSLSALKHFFGRSHAWENTIPLGFFRVGVLSKQARVRFSSGYTRARSRQSCVDVSHLIVI
jgi:hypothetical protein